MLEVRAEGIANITDVLVTGVVLNSTNLEPKKIGVVTLTVDGNDYSFQFELHSEAFNKMSLTGKPIAKTSA